MKYYTLNENGDLIQESRYGHVHTLAGFVPIFKQLVKKYNDISDPNYYSDDIADEIDNLQIDFGDLFSAMGKAEPSDRTSALELLKQNPDMMDLLGDDDGDWLTKAGFTEEEVSALNEKTLVENYDPKKAVEEAVDLLKGELTKLLGDKYSVIVGSGPLGSLAVTVYGAEYAKPKIPLNSPLYISLLADIRHITNPSAAVSIESTGATSRGVKFRKITSNKGILDACGKLLVWFAKHKHEFDDLLGV